MTDSTRAKVRAVAMALDMLADTGVLTCSARCVWAKLRVAVSGREPFPWDRHPTETSITSLARAHLPGVVGDDLVWDCLRGAALYAAMERGS